MSQACLSVIWRLIFAVVVFNGYARPTGVPAVNISVYLLL